MQRKRPNSILLLIIIISLFSATPTIGKPPEIGTFIHYSVQSSDINNYTQGSIRNEDVWSFWINVTKISLSDLGVRVEGNKWDPRWTPVVNKLTDLDDFHFNQFPFFFILTDWTFWTNEITNNGSLQDSYILDPSYYDQGTQTEQTLFQFTQNTTHFNIFFEKKVWRNSSYQNDDGKTISVKSNTTTQELLVFEKEFGTLVLQLRDTQFVEVSEDEPTYIYQSRTQIVAINITSPFSKPSADLFSFGFQVDERIKTLLVIVGLVSVAYLVYLGYKRKQKSQGHVDNVADLYPVDR